jgi:Na+-driven multidrug efflux pump
MLIKRSMKGVNIYVSGIQPSKLLLGPCTCTLSGVMRGAGDTVTPMWISLITTIILRVPIAYTIAYFTRSAAYPTGRPESTYVSLLVSWVFGAIITTIFFKKGKWREKGLANQE